MNRILGVFFIIIFMALFIAIGALGTLFYQQYYPNLLSQNDRQELSQLRVLKSGVIISMLAYGQVENISGNAVTVSSGGQNLSISIDPTAEIGSIDSNGNYVSAQISDIKVGQNLQMEVALSSGNQLTSSSVLISNQ